MFLIRYKCYSKKFYLQTIPLQPCKCHCKQNQITSSIACTIYVLNIDLIKFSKLGVSILKIRQIVQTQMPNAESAQRLHWILFYFLGVDEN